MQTRWSSPMKTMQWLRFIAFVNIFFINSGSKENIVLNIEQWKNEGKVVWNLSEYVKTFMITQKQRRVAYLFSSIFNFSYRTILKQMVKSSPLECSHDFVFENKSLTIWDGCLWGSQATFLFRARTESALESCWKVKKKAQLREWKTAFDSRDKYVKKGLHEITENRINKAATKRWWFSKAKQAEGKPGFQSIEWSVLPSVLLLPNAERPFTWFSNLK